MNDRKALLQSIRALDLAILDTGLYLDAYENQEAATYVNTLLEERRNLAALYTKEAPLVKTDNERAWVTTPWPWEWEAD